MVDEAVQREAIAEMVSTCACLNLRKATRAVTRLFDEALRPLGIRSTQLPILATLALDSPLTVTQISEALVMDRTSLARLLRPLAESNLITVEVAEDRRARNVHLTQTGRAVVDQAFPLWKSVQTRVVSELGHDWKMLRHHLGVLEKVRR